MAMSAEDIAALANQSAQAPAKTTTADYIGPAVGTKTETMIGDQGMRRQTQTVQTAVPARYVTDDKWAVWGEMSIGQQIEIQQALKDAGYIDSFRPGVITNSEFGAMNEVMAMANASGTDWMSALRTSRANAAANPKVGGGGAGRKVAKNPLIFQLSNPDNVKAVAQKAARDLLGRKMTDTETKAFVDSFHAAERDYQSAAHAITDDSASGTTIMDAPDVSVAADTAIRKTNPTEVGATQVANVFNSFTSLLDGRLG